MKGLLPRASEADIKFLGVMLDANGDGHIALEELLSAAKECSEAVQMAIRDDPSVADVLTRISKFMKQDQVRLEARLIL